LGLRALRLFQHGVSFRKLLGGVLPRGVRLVMPAGTSCRYPFRGVEFNTFGELGAACAS
jgi:hypothetical protein